jgi:hypothetical protein
MDYYYPKNSFSLLSRLSIHANRNPYLLLLFFFVQASLLLTGSSTVTSPPHINSLFSHRNLIISLSPSISLWVTSFSPRSLSMSFLSRSLISLSGALSEIGDEFHFLTLRKTLLLEKGWIAQTFCLACISATSLGYLLRRIQRCSLILRRLHYRTKQVATSGIKKRKTKK